MAASLEIVAELPDPVGIVAEIKPPNKLEISRVRYLLVSLVLFMNHVECAADAAGLCLKSVMQLFCVVK